MPIRFIAATVLLLAAAAAPAAERCALSIEGNDAMAFNTAELVVPAGCHELTLTLRHTGTLAVDVMGHNWVLAETRHFDALSAATLTADAADGYLPRNDARVIAATKLIGGGQTATVTFPLARLGKGGDYTFFCSYPGHWSMMKGKLVVQ